MQLNENQYFETVNQRVLGSSPRGGAESERAAHLCGSFLFVAFVLLSRRNPLMVDYFRRNPEFKQMLVHAFCGQFEHVDLLALQSASVISVYGNF